MGAKIYKLITNIRWSDTDKNGHVNNGRYFDYFEEARTTWAYEKSNIIEWAEKNNIQLVIAEQCCKYKLPLLHPNKIEITQTIARCSSASIELYYELRVAGNEQIFTTANVKLACYNATTGRLQKIPKEIRENIS